MLKLVNLNDFMRQAIADLVSTATLRKLNVGHSHQWIFRRTSGQVDMTLADAALIAQAVTGEDGEKWVLDVVRRYQSTPDWHAVTADEHTLARRKRN